MNSTLLHPGLSILYYGKRKWFFRTTVAFGYIIGRESDLDIFHVATFRSGSVKDDELEVDIGLIPLTRKALEQSISRVVSEVQVPDFFLGLVADWRRRKESEEIGAFSVPIWKAEEAAWDSAIGESDEVNPLDYMIEMAFPKRGDDGKFRVVEVSCVPRSSVKFASLKSDNMPSGR